MPASPLTFCSAILLGAGLACGQPLAHAADEPDEPPRPPVGRSLFDFLVAADSGRVPFPFDALLRRIGRQVEGGTKTGIRAVLIPLGRSLQRHAAGDDYFRYPRVVAAVVGEPAPAGGSAGMQLKDRLYLAYHEKAGLLEVISYNEAGGRFEFQVVEDYRDGGAPRLLYANRRLCLSCHQNGAPIFSRPPWDETNVNPALRPPLHAQKRDYYGIAVDLGADAPNAIDEATNRANRFEVVQRLWRQGCGAPRPAAAVRCRAEAFAAVLKYRLSGDRQIDQRARGYREDFTPVLTETWRTRWPAGIAIPSPDLPNRDPLAPIAAEFDPLAAREPIDLRFGTRREDLAHFVRNLAEFMTEGDVLALDRWLYETHARAGGKVQALHVPCRVRERARGPQLTQIEFACTAPAAMTPDITVAGRLEARDAQVTSGVLERFTPSRKAVRDIPLLPAAIARRAGGVQIDLALAPSALRLRPEDGRSVARVTLHWSAPQRLAAGEMTTGVADIWLLEDFAPVAEAIQEMAQETLAGGGDLFSAQPFRRSAVMETLFAKLGMPTRSWCCLDTSGMPPAAAPEDHPRESIPAALAPFYRACAGCHEARQSFPPGFLHGGHAQVLRSIDACAERMLFRLGMWRFPAEARPKSPMPPAADAGSRGSSLPLDEMTRYLSERIRAMGGDPDGVLGARYDALRRCAPR